MVSVAVVKWWYTGLSGLLLHAENMAVMWWAAASTSTSAPGGYEGRQTRNRDIQLSSVKWSGSLTHETKIIKQIKKKKNALSSETQNPRINMMHWQLFLACCECVWNMHERVLATVNDTEDCTLYEYCDNLIATRNFDYPRFREDKRLLEEIKILNQCLQV